MKKALKITGFSALGLVVFILCWFVAFFVYSKSYKVEVAPTHENNTEYVQAYGRGLYEKNGNEIIFEGTNLGAYFVTEGWLMPYATVDPTYNEKNEPQYPELSQDQFLNAMKANPNLTDADIEEILDVYYTNWITKEDIQRIKNFGMNCVRIPFGYKMILNDDLTLKDETTAFKYLDQVISWCKDCNIYVVLDLHTTPGSHNGYEHSGTTEYKSGVEGSKFIGFWDNETYVDAIIKLWKKVGTHYMVTKPELGKTIAMYDILNEPRNECAYTDKECWDVMDKIYDDLREVDDKHVICLEGCWSFAGLPNPTKYGWENVCYSYHWYNFPQAWWDAFYAYQDAFNMFRDYEVPVFQGEFTFFDGEENWLNGLQLFEDRHYSWTLWTYKKVVAGWWNDSWSMYNLKLIDENGNNIIKVNVSNASKKEIIDAFKSENIDTSKAEESSTFRAVKKFLESK